MRTVKGFSLLEMLIALAIGGILLPGAARLIPMITLWASLGSQRLLLDDELWQLATTLGKHLQRAGYCNGVCSGQALHLELNCFVARWDVNHNGTWATTPTNQSGVFAFRLREGSLQTSRGNTQCDGGSWERITDPQWVTLSGFVVSRVAQQPATFAITLEGALRQHPQISSAVTHHVTGYNL